VVRHGVEQGSRRVRAAAHGSVARVMHRYGVSTKRALDSLRGDYVQCP
jgi:hypothetical protein